MVYEGATLTRTRLLYGGIESSRFDRVLARVAGRGRAEGEDMFALVRVKTSVVLYLRNSFPFF